MTVIDLTLHRSEVSDLQFQVKALLAVLKELCSSEHPSALQAEKMVLELFEVS